MKCEFQMVIVTLSTNLTKYKRVKKIPNKQLNVLLSTRKLNVLNNTNGQKAHL